MDKHAIYHRVGDNYSYVLDKDTVHIRLRTKKNDIEQVQLIFGDPYDFNGQQWIYKKEYMTKSGSTDLFDYWFIAMTPEHHRIRYGFELQSGQETLIYTEKGFFDHIPNDDVAYYFCIPYIHEIDKFTAPTWVKDTIWYQIFPERFANGDASINPEGTLPWGSTDPTPTNFFGGDLQGVIDHLDYLEELGINGIYFTPIFKAHSNHKYDTIDYMELDPQFGSKETLTELIRQAHQKGISIMFDAVFNHSGFLFPKWQDVIEKGEHSPYKDWFFIHNFPIQTEPRPNYETFAFTPFMPKLNTHHPDVKEYLLEVGRYWVREFHIDGWRLDVANEIDHSFWREFRTEIKAINPDVYILGEIWHDSMPWLQGDQFDAVMNYPFTNAVVEYFAKQSISTKQFEEKIMHVSHMYPTHINEVAFNLLDSHDTPRILTLTNNNIDTVKLIYVFLLSNHGTPCIYYGDEIGMDGGQDPGCRKCMVWEKDSQNIDLFTHIQKLITLRKTIPTFSNDSNLTFIDTHSEVIMYTKESEQDIIFFTLNNTNDKHIVSLPVEGKGKLITDLMNNQELAFDTASLNLSLQSKEFSILHMKK